MTADGERELDGRWLEEQRAAIEGDKRKSEQALALFRKSIDVLPRLSERLDEGRREAARLRDELAAAARRATDEVARLGAEQAATLTARLAELADEARRSLGPVMPAIEELQRRAEAAESALAQDRRAMNELNRRLLEQGSIAEGLSRRLDEQAERAGAMARQAQAQAEAIEALTRRAEAAEASGQALRHDDATIRGTVASVHGQLSWLVRFTQWFTAAGWWGRLFGRPPE